MGNHNGFAPTSYWNSLGQAQLNWRKLDFKRISQIWEFPNITYK